MATIRLVSYAINEIGPWGISLNLHLGGDNPIPTRTIEAKRVAEVQAALDDYAKTAEASGKAVQISAVCVKGRKPAGFDAAPFDRIINAHAAKRAA